ncbi:MAG TPA: GNAT family N-acyltransferase [Blastocatellia bacterium]|nr:GNAT family N-acyltransferase [Blastocatellia bacterium]
MQTVKQQHQSAFELIPTVDGKVTSRLFWLIKRPVERLFQLDKLSEFYEELVDSEDPRHLFERALEALDVDYRATARDIARIPKTGPVVVVANHPFGAVEGIILFCLLRSVRPDVMLLANSLLCRIRELEDVTIPVNPFGTPDAPRSNVRGLKRAVEFLRNRGMLVVFPAGEVAHLNVRERAITDPRWSNTVGKLIRITGASVVPVYFAGSNGTAFQIAGLLHPRLRTAMLPHELLNKRGRRIDVRIGVPIRHRRLAELDDDDKVTAYLRKRTYLLRRRTPVESPVSDEARLLEPVARPTPGELLNQEIEALREQNTLVVQGEYEVFYTNAWKSPHVLKEIGRQREIAFRAAGEGSGKSRDLDEFDAYYIHLFVWNRHAHELVGAYRVGSTADVLGKMGRSGLYTSTLFEYDDSFLHKLGPSMELGRAFVRAEYQRSFSPLMLLWQGIGKLLARNPQCETLFGAVSVSNSYSSASRGLMVEFLKERHYNQQLGSMVKARIPFVPMAGEFEVRPRDIEELSDVVSDLEADGKGLPVLLRQYLRLNAEVLSFNRDPHFGDSLDGLIVVRLSRVDPRTLERVAGISVSAS